MSLKSGKFFKLVMAAALCMAMYFTVIVFTAGCNTVKAQDIELSGMKTEFDFSEEFSTEGLVVTVLYADGTSKVAERSEYSIDTSQFNGNASGVYTITVKLKGTKIERGYTVKVADEEDLWSYDGALKVLCIGNSFSVDMAEYAYQIAKSLGVEEIYLGNLYIGGCTLDTHAGNARNDSAAYTYYENTDGKWSENRSYKMSTAIASQNWDFITLQQASGSSGIETTYSELDYLINYVKENLPEKARTKLVWHQTWAYQGDSSHSEFYKYDSSQIKMYEMIVSVVQNKILTNDAFKTVIPDGTAIQNARTSFCGDNFTRDGYHLSLDVGRYIAGLTMIHTLTKLPISDIAYAPENVDDALKALAIESAENAVKTPLAVTDSEYGEYPAPDAESYTALDIDLTQGFWDSTSANSYNVLRTNDSLTDKYYGTKRFTKEEIPAGSIIIVENGWQYRPEAWITDARQTTRPANVSVTRVEVTEGWWGNYTLRAFNISKTGTPVIEGMADEAKAAFKIYVPKSAN